MESPLSPCIFNTALDTCAYAVPEFGGSTEGLEIEQLKVWFASYMKVI